ncbi:MAG: leucine--tRNA ligase [Phycisphaeraceae bacterium]|nr:MAG: leucine--tRNA ligase [Phycisphaeraceae bacterium]
MTEQTSHHTPSGVDAAGERHRYDAACADRIERKWQMWWSEHDTFRTPNPSDPGFDASRPKYFVLDMFPYPSGAGLHVGHPEGYTATDIIGRYKRMRGCNVLHPMGWDAFGLPAEQYAIQTNVHPATTTRNAIETFRRQLQRFGFAYDWSREFATIDPDYYRWTQWIFLALYNAWYDTHNKRARPISELTDALEADQARIDQSGTVLLRDHPNFPHAQKWSGMDPVVQRHTIDDQRLAYLAEQSVNWCPKLGTVLANEEVIDGKSERGGHSVRRVAHKQWMLRITAYADRLLEDLNDLDWPTSTKTQQREWIGRSEGAYIDFPAGKRRIRVFTTRPDTVFGATYMVLAPEHPLVDELAPHAYGGTVPPSWRCSGFPGADDLIARNASPREVIDAYRAWVAGRTDVERQAEAKIKSGVFTGAYALNPVNQQRVPIFIADYVLMGYGTGAIMAVPGQDQRDWDFAKVFGLPIIRTVQPPEGFTEHAAFTGEGPAINSDFLNGLNIPDAKRRIIAWLEEHKAGKRAVTYKLRDWLFSRQRYWGEPFPIVFDELGNHHPIAADKLPVALPELDDFRPPECETPTPLLGKATDWVRTTAGEAGVDPASGLPPEATVWRETNTMPNWAGSCWYYLRYCDPKNPDRFVGREAERYWMGENGVDLYIGGNEHAVLHLLYARFWHKVLFDLGHVTSPEPFRKLFHQGLITSFAYQRADKSLVAIDAVENRGTEDAPEWIEIATGEPVTQTVAKMSKSLKNVVNPDDIIAEFGADTFRLYEMYLGPLEASKPWNTRDTVGLFRFLQRVWRLVIDENTGNIRTRAEADPETEKALHRTIAKVGEDIERLAFNTAIAAMIEFVNLAFKADGLTEDQIDRFARILSPFAPHLAEEVWERLGRTPAAADQAWPAYEASMLVDDEVEIPVQILGKVRAKITVPADADEKAVEAAALANDRIAELLDGKTVRKVIVIPGRLVNIVAN